MPTKIKKSFLSFVFAQMNAASCMGEQNKKDDVYVYI